MMKIRDKADYNALEKLGLVEPEDTAKALELGFPKRSVKPLTMSPSIGDDKPVPMPLAGHIPDMEEVLVNTTTRKCFMCSGCRLTLERALETTEVIYCLISAKAKNLCTECKLFSGKFVTRVQLPGEQILIIGERELYCNIKLAKTIDRLGRFEFETSRLALIYP